MGWSRFFRRRYWDAERRRELESYIEIETDENVARGMPRGEARAAAVRRLGDARAVRETIYDANSIRPLETLARDLRLAARWIGRRKGIAAVVVVSLALGIGANTLVFSLVEGVLLRPFPYERPEEVVLIRDGRDRSGGARLSEPDLLDYIAQSTTLEGLAPYMASEMRSLEDEAPVRVAVVGSEAFRTLGVDPLIGPGFPPSDQVALFGDDEDQIVMLAHGYWQSRYGGDPAVVGQTLRMDSRPYRIVGIMPPGFFFPEHDVQVWEPAPFSIGTGRSFRVLLGIARLKSGVSLRAAQGEIDVISRGLDEAYPRSTDNPREVTVFPIHDVVVGNYTTVLWLLFGAVALVLTIACANVANLFLAENLARQKELAIRATLGAGRLALVRQGLVESLLLALLAGAAAVGLAYLGQRLVPVLGLVEIPRIGSVALNLPVLGFAAAVSLATGLLAGVLPAWKAAQGRLIGALQQGGHSISRPVDRRLADALVVTQVTLALVLLVGTGLLVRSSVALSQVPWGFDPENVSVVAVRATAEFDQDSLAERIRFADAVLNRLRGLPSVSDAGAGVTAPLLPGTVEIGIPMVRAGQPVSSAVTAAREIITPGYLEALGVLVRGRGFDARETAGEPRAVVLSASLARELFGAEEPIGQSVHFATLRTPSEDSGTMDVRQLTSDIADFEVSGTTAHTIVGIAGDVKMTGDLTVGGGRPVAYVDYRQYEERWTDFSAGALSGIGFATGVNPTFVGAFTIRSEGDPQPVIDAAKAAILADNPELSFLEAAPMSTLVSRALGAAGPNRLALALSVVFGGLSLVLAATGIYGVLTHRVRQRTYEIGVRMALGARPNEILGMVLAQGFRLAGTGLVLGLAGAWAGSRSLESMLFGISTTDAVTFATVTATLLGIALGASFLPALRASRTDPLEATRAE